MAKYDIYTDGSLMTQGERLMGGWAFVVVDTEKNEIVHKDFGKIKSKTESCVKTELEAMYQALLWIDNNIKEDNVHVISDNEVLVGSIDGECKRNTNRQYWDLIEPLCKNMLGRLSVSHVKSHVQDDKKEQRHKYNAICDRLAKKGANSLLIKGIKER